MHTTCLFSDVGPLSTSLCSSLLPQVCLSLQPLRGLPSTHNPVLSWLWQLSGEVRGGG